MPGGIDFVFDLPTERPDHWVGMCVTHSWPAAPRGGYIHCLCPKIYIKNIYKVKVFEMPFYKLVQLRSSVGPCPRVWTCQGPALCVRGRGYSQMVVGRTFFIVGPQLKVLGDQLSSPHENSTQHI